MLLVLFHLEKHFQKSQLDVTYVCREQTKGPGAFESSPLRTRTRRSRRPRQRCEQDTVNTPAAATTSYTCLGDTLKTKTNIKQDFSDSVLMLLDSFDSPFEIMCQ